jgi:hypothetical protein
MAHGLVDWLLQLELGCLPGLVFICALVTRRRSFEDYYNLLCYVVFGVFLDRSLFTQGKPKE